MGKCVSKQTGHLGSSSYIAICNEDDILYINVGQSESKKSKKTGLETKGTAMSFGFKKKIAKEANKKNANTIIDQKQKEAQSTVISNPGILKPSCTTFGDANGNTDSTESLDENSSKTGRTTPRLQPPKKDINGAATRSNRFGFRQSNIVRPASAGLTPKLADFDVKTSNAINNNNINNNNNVYVTDKRRSKSASATSRTNITTTNHSSLLQHYNKPQPKYQPNPKINTTESDFEQQQSAKQEQNSNSMNSDQISQSTINNCRNQYTVIDSGLHTNPIIKPVPKTFAQQQQPQLEPPVSVSKFTLHTTSLPKPQYPVPISLNADASRNLMDIKGVKQAENISRKGLGSREESADSGIASHDSYCGASNMNAEDSDSRMPRQRYRNLEMVMSGRHKFQVRDLEALTDEPLIPLTLPKLPSAFNDNANQPAPLCGLVRSTEVATVEYDADDNRYVVERKDSINSSDVESLEEEKLMRDNNSSEKSLKGAFIKDISVSQYSKNSSSPGSSRASWCNAGETMAIKDKDYSSLSLSSSDDSNLNAKLAEHNRNTQNTKDEEDLSSITITDGHHSLLLSSMTASFPDTTDMQSRSERLSEVQINFNDETDSDSKYYKTEEKKFAEMAAAVSDALLLDDETSPADSLVSSITESDDARKNKKKVENNAVKEKDIDEISPELDELASPMSPGTPTHASNSLSLSDGGRDFLIDDEIADQPALVFDDKNMNDTSMIELNSINLNLNSHTDTPTLKESVSSHKAPVPKPRKILPDHYESPALSRRAKNRLNRAESLDTLSPCDSITSDDFMLDFDLDCNSSMDSIDKAPKSNESGSQSALHSMDELQLWNELENKGGQIMREWSTLLRSQRCSNQSSRESITSQLPARATRLLTRRLQNNATPNGSESPRSIDSFPRRALSASLKASTLNALNDSISTATNSAEDLTLLDKSLRNSMLQDVVHFKKQLVRLRRILQEDEENLMMTDTLNPFENTNGQFFSSPSDIDCKQQENTLIKESGVVALLEDQRQELADLRRQVVYLQSQMDDKDRTIRIQQNLIEKYEAEKNKEDAKDESNNNLDLNKASETISTATQTERLRPLSMGQEGLASRSEHPHNTQLPLRNGIRSIVNNNSTISPPGTTINNKVSNLKPKTQISSIYTQLSSIKHSNSNNINNNSNASTNNFCVSQKKSSVSINNVTTSNNNKTVRTTQIGNILTATKMNQNGVGTNNVPTTALASKLIKSSIKNQMLNTKCNTGNSVRSKLLKCPTSPVLNQNVHLIIEDIDKRKENDGGELMVNGDTVDDINNKINNRMTGCNL